MFTKAVKIFSVRGIEIKIDPSWFLIATLITWSLSQHYFPETYGGGSNQLYLLMALVAMLCFFGSLLLHELAHALVARRHGVPIAGITLFLFGGVAELTAQPQTPRQELQIALAGPLMSLALSFGFWALAQVIGSMIAASPIVEVVGYLAMINLVLALFNLVPAFPLDGGRILRAYLWQRSGNILQATETASKSGTAFALFLIALGVLNLVWAGAAGGLWYVMIGAFILFAARSTYQNQLAQSEFQTRIVQDLMTRNPIVAPPEMTLTDLAEHIMMAHGISFVPVLEDGVLLGHVDKGALLGIDRENWNTTKVGDVFVGLAETPAVTPQTPILSLIATISNTPQRKFLVTEDHRLMGVITLSDLTDFLQKADHDRHATTRRHER